MNELLNDVLFLTKGTGSVKFTSAEKELIKNKWKDLTSTSEPLNFREFFLKVIDKALKPANSKESLALIKNLQKEISELKEQISPQTQRIAEVDKILAEKDEEISVLTQKLSFTNDKTFVEDGQIVLDISPSIEPFLRITAEKESKRTGKAITPQMILLQLFWLQIKDGPGDHIPFWSTSEIKNVLKEVKEKQSQSLNNE